jgi:hypothetical protein
MTRKPRASCKNVEAPEYAPALFARQPEAIAAGFTEADFKAAQDRLLAAGKIKSVPYGRYRRIVIVKK